MALQPLDCQWWQPRRWHHRWRDVRRRQAQLQPGRYRGLKSHRHGPSAQRLPGHRHHARQNLGPGHRRAGRCHQLHRIQQCRQVPAVRLPQNRIGRSLQGPHCRSGRAGQAGRRHRHLLRAVWHRGREKSRPRRQPLQQLCRPGYHHAPNHRQHARVVQERSRPPGRHGLVCRGQCQGLRQHPQASRRGRSAHQGRRASRRHQKVLARPARSAHRQNHAGRHQPRARPGQHLRREHQGHHPPNLCRACPPKGPVRLHRRARKSQGRRPQRGQIRV